MNPAKLAKLTESQSKVLSFLVERRGQWFRPSQIHPPDYPGGDSAVGRVLSSLQELKLVDSRKSDRGNGTACTEYSACRRALNANK